MTPPNADFTLDLESMNHISTFYNLWLERFASEQGISFCHLAGGLPPNEAVFYDDLHFNEQGSKEVAQIIFDCLRREKSSRN